jgi:hypothetical protein
MHPAKLYIHNFEAFVVECCQRLVIHQGASWIISYLDGFFVLAACIKKPRSTAHLMTALMSLGCGVYDE